MQMLKFRLHYESMAAIRFIPPFKRMSGCNSAVKRAWDLW